MSTILLLEDDRNVRESLCRYLIGQGMKVVEAGTLSEARAKIPMADLAIFDWQLPDGEGIDLLKEIRKDHNELPVIILTARKDVVDKVIGLEIGADDYMVKPFEPRELLARIRLRLLKNHQVKPESRSLSFCGIEIDRVSREVFSDGKPVELTKLEFNLLVFLAESPNRVFTRNELLDEIWGVDEMSETRAVDNHVFQLRKKLNKNIFKTIRGIGYRLCIEE